MTKQLRQTILPAFVLGAAGSAEADALGYFSLVAGSGITLTPASGSLTIAATGSGTVTSVGLSLPNLFTVAGSPVTGSGTLTATLATQAANQVFVGPTTGANAAPTFRTLVVGDIPALTAAKISDFDTQVRTSRLDQMAAPTVSVAFNSQRITGLADPSGAQDAATKAYVDAISQGLDVKQSVRAATTANITLSAPQTIDGVSVIAGDRVLVKNQSTGSQNGIYVVAASAWTRAADANSATNFTAGAFTFVEEGTVNADSGWVLTTNNPITIDTTGLTFAQFSGAGQVVAGAGLTKTGNTLDVGGTASRIVVNADTIDIAGDYVGQNTIATVGTITTGTWSATAITATRGGTGLTTVPKGAVLVAHTADEISALDGGGSINSLLAYTAATDTIAWANGLSGDTYTIQSRQTSGIPAPGNWSTAEPAFDPTAGRLYVKGSSAMVEYGRADLPISNTATGGGTYTLQLSDIDRVILANTITISIPTDATLDFPIGTKIWIYNNGTAAVLGTVNIVAASPGTTTVTGGDSGGLPGQGLALLYKVAANTWCRLFFVSGAILASSGQITTLQGTSASFQRYAVSSLTTISGTSHTLASTNNGAVLRFTASSAVTVAIPTGLSSSFSCSIIQEGTGQITITPDAGVTRNAFGGATKTAGQYAVATLIATASNTFILGGQVVV